MQKKNLANIQPSSMTPRIVNHLYGVILSRNHKSVYSIDKQVNH